MNARRRQGMLAGGLAVAACAVAIHAALSRLGGRRSGPLSQSAYVWQRAWNNDVRAGIRRAAPRLDSLVVLSAEVAWEAGRPRVVRVPIDYAALRACGRRVGLALRIGPFAGPLSEDDATGRWIATSANELVVSSRSAGVDVVELQVDFDCAASRLGGYAGWVRAIRSRLASVPVVITALPSWLDRREFRELATAAGGYVLQVHSIERPRGIDEALTLCDPRAAKRAVEKAGRMGVPFRVALPTYGYTIAFDRSGRFLGLRAEGPSARWPEDVRLRTLCADAPTMAGLVRDWTADRPACLRGIVWYRLPMDADALNWRWPTLAAVLAGRDPRPALRARARRSEAGLYDLDLVNDGDGDALLPRTIAARWNRAVCVTADGLGGYRLADRDERGVRFQRAEGTEPNGIRPEERRTIGWVRLDADAEVHVEFTSASD